VGFTGAPRILGRDEKQRLILEYVPGTMADALPAMTQSELRRVGGLIRALHDAVATFRPPPDASWHVLLPAPDAPDIIPADPARADLICHHDVAPWNLVRDGDRWVFIDWDGAGPSTRLWDLAYAAHGFVPLSPGGDPTVDAPRLRALVDGYGLDDQQRRELPPLIAAHTRAMYDLLHASSLTGAQPWARLYAEGHGDHWGPAAAYIARHIDVWTTALLA